MFIYVLKWSITQMLFYERLKIDQTWHIDGNTHTHTH